MHGDPKIVPPAATRLSSGSSHISQSIVLRCAESFFRFHFFCNREHLGNAVPIAGSPRDLQQSFY